MEMIAPIDRLWGIKLTTSCSRLFFPKQTDWTVKWPDFIPTLFNTPGLKTNFLETKNLLDLEKLIGTNGPKSLRWAQLTRERTRVCRDGET